MRCRPERWWRGLPALALVWAAAAWVIPALESDLAGQLKERLAAGPEGWASVEMAGRDAALTGEAPSREARDRALAALDLPGLRRVEDRTTLQAVPGNYEWSALREPDRLVLRGLVPDPATRRALLEEAGRIAPSLRIDDEAGQREGAPPAFAAGAAAALRALLALERGQATLLGPTLGLQGIAGSAEGYNRAAALLGSLPEGVEAGRIEITPPTLSPFRFALARAGDRLTLDGHVPSEPLRADLVAAARRSVPEAVVEDRMQTALGAPPDLDLTGFAARALDVLARLDDGRVGIEERRVTAQGRTGDKGALGAIEAALRATAAGPLELAALDLRAVPVVPYTFAARRGGGALTLSGHVPDEASRAELLRAARRGVLGDRIVDRVRLADGAPAGFAAAAGYLLDALGQLAAGEASLNGTALTLRGEGLYPQATEALQARAAGSVPAGFTASVALSVRGAEAALDAEACRRALAAIVERGAIQFEPNSAAFRRPSYGTLDDVARVARRCAARIEIGGHLDAEANAEATRDLSLRRAQAVRDHLVRAGVEPGRLEAVGYGGTRPLVPNEGEDNRARNQRIEFTVKG